MADAGGQTGEHGPRAPESDAGVRVEVLGQFRATAGGRPVDLGGPRQRAVLALLLLAHGDTVTVDRLIDCLWGEEPPPSALSALQAYISRLRQRLQPGQGARTRAGVIVNAAGGYALRVDPGAVDAWWFEELVRTAATAEPRLRADALSSALQLWRGPMLAEYAQEPWAQPQVTRLDALRTLAQEQLADARLASGEAALLVPELERMVEEHPLREERWRLLALAYYRSHRQADALAALRRARQTLVEELGVEPAPALRQLETDILAHSPSLDLPVPAAPEPQTAGTPAHPSDLVSSPVLVGRDELLALAERRVAETVRGRGQLLLVNGEAGSGKTRLLDSIGRTAVREGFAVVRATAFRGDVESSGGLLLDLADDLRRSEGVAAQTAGVRLAERLRAPQDDGDAHRQRRLLVQDLAEALHRLDPARRLLVILEDLHWADRLSLEVLRHWALRLSSRHTLLLGAYRSDELFPGSPVRDWRSDLLSQRTAEEIRIPRLTLEQTATLVSTVLGRPAPARLVKAVQERSDGIPLHVEELVAAAGADLSDVDALRLPETLADAVLVRAEGLGVEDRLVVAAAAAIGRTFDFDLLVEVSQVNAEAVDAGLRRLQGLYLVQPGSADHTFDFRHALIRDALYSAVPLPQRRELHGRVATAAVARGYHDSFVSAQFEQAVMREPAHRHAVAGARQASALSAHRESLALYRRAMRMADPDLPVQVRARLLAELADEAAATDENDEAAQAYERAAALLSQDGARVESAALVPPLVAVRHLLGDPLAAREQRLRDALASVAGLPGAEAIEARLLAGLAAAYMLDRRLERAIEYGLRGRELGHGAGDEAADLNAAVTLGSALVFAGRLDEGWQLLEQAVVRARALNLEAEAARAYRMIGSCASVLVEYERAERWLQEGIGYAERVELGNHRSYMLAHLAHVQWATGDWASAQLTAQQALADGRGGITTRITATYVLGYVALGRGEWTTGRTLLEEALALGESMAELQRVSPPLWGLAETALLTGDLETAVSLCRKGLRLSEEVEDAAYLFPFVVTGTRSLLSLGDPDAAVEWIEQCTRVLALRAIPGTLAALVQANGLVEAAKEKETAQSTLARAAEDWRQRGRRWEAAWCELDQARAARAARRHAEATVLVESVASLATTIGSQPLMAAAEALHRTERDRAWHPLTDREWSIAALVAQGLTNREIASRLTVSPKTVSTHVEHILAKLGAGRRAEIAAWATRVEG